MPKRKFSRLTNDQKQALRGELDAKIPVTDLAKKYGVSRRTIYNLKNRWEERLPQSRSKVLTVRVSAEDMERLDALVANLLDMARIQSGAITLRREWQSLEEIIGTAIQSVRRQLGPRAVTVTLPPDLPLVDVFSRGGALKSSWYGDCLPSR